MNLREIDGLVAEKVMGWKYIGEIFPIGSRKPKAALVSDGWGKFEFSPSSNIADAWKVVEKIKKANFSARHRFITELQKEVTPKELKDKNQLLDLGWMIFFLTPKDICIAALKAAGVEVNIE